MVLKQQKQRDIPKEIAEELFDTEVNAYDRLKPLQGLVIPTCYGRVSCNGARALILEHIGGISMSSPEGATFRLDELPPLFQPCYRAFHALGAYHGDANLSNFHLVNGKIMALDLESVVFELSMDELVRYMASDIWDLAYRYRSMQAHYRHEGSLEAAKTWL